MSAMEHTMDAVLRSQLRLETDPLYVSGNRITEGARHIDGLCASLSANKNDVRSEVFACRHAIQRAVAALDAIEKRVGQ